MKTVLLVDDDSSLRNSLSSYLSSSGFSVQDASDVSSALFLIKVSRPHIIVTDVIMPQLTGYDFIKILKSDKRLSYIPVVLLTVKGMTYDRIKGYDLGCCAYLIKPFNPQELLSLINSLCSHIKYFDSFHQSHSSSGILFNLTSKERDVLYLLLQGYMNKEIAVKLNLKIRNVEKYVSRLLLKTRTRNRTELVQLILNS
uniref:TctD-like protein n=1 Tax=Spyridia filamentosa TaxID=196632 RepID=A0A1Z1MJP7_SPYFI|nr:hypothetical protein [Spyridia filamentosa]ARW66300.1 hypothetical protein [Spyridia filamentosa]